jgi:hypothetical protein
MLTSPSSVRKVMARPSLPRVSLSGFCIWAAKSQSLVVTKREYDDPIRWDDNVGGMPRNRAYGLRPLLSLRGCQPRRDSPVSYPLATPLYSGMGRPSIAPQKLLRAMLLQGRIEAVAANPGA